MSIVDVGSRGRQLRCARQAIHGTGTRQLSYQESQFKPAVSLSKLDLEILHAVNKLKLTAYKMISYGKHVGCANLCNVY